MEPKWFLAVKVTPAHDPNDYATGQRHTLPQINLLTPDGKVNDNGGGEFLGARAQRRITGGRGRQRGGLVQRHAVLDHRAHRARRTGAP